MTLLALKRMVLHVTMVATVAAAGVAQAQTDQPQTQPSETSTGEPLKSNIPNPDELPPCPPEQPVATPTPTPPAPAPALVPMHHEKHYSRIFAPNSIGLVTGAGVGNYFGSAVQQVDAGPNWDARVILGTRSIMAVEAGYTGGTNEANPNGANNAHLNTNGIDGTFRLQLPFKAQPYIFSGVGWQRMTLDNAFADGNVSARYTTRDDQLVVPAGGGFAGYIGRHLTLDARGTYKYVTNNDITIMSDRALHQWVAQARVGYVF
jgi:hypothetical protein